MTGLGPNRVVRLVGPRRLELVETAAPEPIAGTVVVAIDRCGIGGPDIDAWTSGELPAPAWLGHEWVGRIVAVGPDVEGHFEGERVVGATAPPCGHCGPCRAGLSAACELSLAMIVGRDDLAPDHGAFADLIRVDARRAHRAPDGIDLDQAALAEPAAVAAHAVARGGPGLGDLVAVVGAGTIGLLVAAFSRLAGAARVVAVDPDPERRELACTLGADAAFAPGPGVTAWLADHGHGLGADRVYECAGHPQATTGALAAARPGGTVVVVGVSDRVDDLRPGDLVRKQLTVRAALGYTVTDVDRALDLMADDRVRVEPIINRTVGFADLAAVLDELATTPVSPPKVFVRPG